MSIAINENINRWTGKCKTALIIEIIQGKSTVSAAGPSYDLTPSEIGSRLKGTKKGMENSFRANSLDSHAQYEKQLKEL